MPEVPKRITLPKTLQEGMLKFFLRTSIPRKIKAREEGQNRSPTKEGGNG
jgi:hypothetical protein